MKHTQETRGRPTLREELEQAVRSSYQQDEKQEAKTGNGKPNHYQTHAPMNAYTKIGLYVAGAFVLVWSSQYVLAALAGVIRQYKNLKRAIKE